MAALRQPFSRLLATAAASAVCSGATPFTAYSSADDYEYNVRVLGDQPEDEVYATYYGSGILSRKSTERLLHFSHPAPGEGRATDSGEPVGISMCSYPANLPIEDRACVCQATLLTDDQESDDSGDLLAPSSNALSENASHPSSNAINVFAVFDGHGGYQVSDYASLSLVPYLLSSMRDSDPSSPETSAKYVNMEDSNDLRVQRALIESFRRVERDIVTKLHPAFEMGFGNVARVGCCALVAVLQGDTLWVANAGDCAAVIGRRTNGQVNSQLESALLSTEHNIRLQSEKERLLKLCPGELERGLIRCKSETSCYVKGHLQPSRGLGDAYLKYSEFRGPAPTALRPYVRSDPARSRRVRAPFAPPYILTDPEIQSVKICDEDEWLILASDGLWDEMSPQEAVDLCAEFARKKEESLKRDENSAAGSTVIVQGSIDKDSRVLSTSPDKDTSTTTHPLINESTSTGGTYLSDKKSQIARRRSRDPGHMPTVATTAAEYLVHAALRRAAESAGKSLAQIKDLPQGKRRSIHADITVVVIDLAAQRRGVSDQQEKEHL